MSSDPRSLRNIPGEITQIARVIARHSGLSESDILRLALASGILVEVTKVTPDRSGTYGGLQADYLAKALRRHLSAAIDFLLEHGQHPYQGAFNASGTGATLAQGSACAAASTPETTFDTAMADELEGMGIGLGLGSSLEMEGMEVPVACVRSAERIRQRRSTRCAHRLWPARSTYTMNSQQQTPTSGPRRPRPHPNTNTSSAYKTQKLDEQQPPPHTSRRTTEARPLEDGGAEWRAFGQTVYVRDATKHPPGASYIIAFLVGLACVLAVIWQMITTYSAFSNMIFDGTKWLSLSRAGQDAARVFVEIICGIIAVSFQAPLLFWAFKIDKRFATERHRRLSFAAKVSLIWEVAKEVIAGNLFLSLWAGIALVADTIGDVGFLALYTNSPVVLFFYATGLYGLSTIGLSECLQILWDAMVTSEWLQHIRAANMTAMAAARKMMGGTA